MTLQLALITVLWLVGASALVLLATIWQRGHLRRKPWLAYLATASAMYAFGYGLELAGDSAEWVLATFYLQHPAIAFSPTIILLAAIDLGRLPVRLARALLTVTVSVALITIALVYTNPWHDLYHANPRMEQAGPLNLIAFDPGAWYVVFHVSAGLVLLFVNAVFVRTWLRSPAASARRGQAATVALASLVPWAGSLFYVTGVLPIPVDVTPLALAFTTGLVYLGVTRYALADPSPIARDLVFDRMQDPVLVLDTERRLVDHNRAAAHLFADAPSARVGRTLPELLGQDVTLRRRPSTSDTIVESEPLELGGRAYDVRIAQLRDGRSRQLGQAVVLRDITEHARMQRLLTHLAHTDELTGLANRRRFIDLTERVLERARLAGQAITLVVFDLDQFKRVNDTHGHLTGDALLRAIATAAAAKLRPTDLLGRYGGEEFAACLPGAGAQDARSAGERLRAAVAATTVEAHDGSAVGTTASVGACTVGAGTSADLETLLARADAAQYEAKRQGGDRVEAVEISA